MANGRCHPTYDANNKRTNAVDRTQQNKLSTHIRIYGSALGMSEDAITNYISAWHTSTPHDDQYIQTVTSPFIHHGSIIEKVQPRDLEREGS